MSEDCTGTCSRIVRNTCSGISQANFFSAENYRKRSRHLVSCNVAGTEEVGNSTPNWRHDEGSDKMVAPVSALRAWSCDVETRDGRLLTKGIVISNPIIGPVEIF